MVLSIGMAESQMQAAEKGGKGVAFGGNPAEFGRYGATLLCVLAAVLMGRGLLHSFSRGAWLGTVAGIGYLVFQTARQKQKLGKLKSEMGVCNVEFWESASLCSLRSVRLNFNWVSWSVVLLSVIVLFLWQVRGTDWHPVRRAHCYEDGGFFVAQPGGRLGRGVADHGGALLGLAPVGTSRNRCMSIIICRPN